MFKIACGGLCIFMLLTLSSFVLNSNDAEWEVVKSANGIIIFSRLDENSDFKELKIITQLNTSIPAIIALLKDVPNYTQWIYECTESKVVKTVSETEDYYYTRTDAPWPVSDRDIIMHSKLSQNPITKTVISKSIATPHMLSEKEGIVRVKEASACWYFFPKKDSKTIQVVYELKLNPGGSIPAWLSNMTLAIGPYNTILGMKEELKKEKYTSSTFDFIKKQ